MQASPNSFMNEVAEYYSEKLATHGATARGVDWNGAESQNTRFEQLCRIIDRPGHFSLNDLGCGYAALLDHMLAKYEAFDYFGIDISSEMLAAAKERHGDRPLAQFRQASQPEDVCDFSVASGLFNVKLGVSVEDWVPYFKRTLDALDRSSRMGFAFNCLTSYSDEDKKRDYLYYADPCWVFDFCKTYYSRHVSLLHDYGLYEFTILVRKSV